MPNWMQGKEINMKVKAYITDTEGKQVVVSTADTSTDDGRGCVIIEHDGHCLIISADDLYAAIQRAQINPGYDDSHPF